MQKIIHILIAIGILSACQQKENTYPIQAVTIDTDSTLFKSNDSTAAHEYEKRINKELNYYLRVHSFDEEGYDMVANYATRGDRQLQTYCPKQRATILGMLPLKGIWRQGIGISHDTHGNICLGTWKADTLQTGIRLDSTGVYAGQFNREMIAHGHGYYRHFDGSFYEGHWLNNVREGFGFMITLRNIQSGIWKNNHFFGERIMHTSDRIYGIDISRYQHEKGRHRFNIDWNNLRITNLGHRIKGNISGVVDYPVRFVYIKSTQGTTIRNQYFVTDYMKARKHGIPVGTYHFFSTAKDGRSQAHYYLDHTLFKHGDLPPVLDVEPSNSQIKKMGGTTVLLREMRNWIETIERRLHVRPILYVNQRFINEHLSAAPDLMENYLIWIARYGEYKPGVHLALWQLSSDSRVQGIQTDVDVNVFNGYEPQWLEFLREETIKK